MTNEKPVSTESMIKGLETWEHMFDDDEVGSTLLYNVKDRLQDKSEEIAFLRREEGRQQQYILYLERWGQSQSERLKPLQGIPDVAGFMAEVKRIAFCTNTSAYCSQIQALFPKEDERS